MSVRSLKQCFEDDGYAVVRGLIDTKRDVAPFRAGFQRYIDEIADLLMSSKQSSSMRSYYYAQGFAERFAMLIGCFGDVVLHHLDPSLNILLPGYKWREDLPSAQRPELFNLMRNNSILDALELLLGQEISASPVYHINVKLTKSQMEFADKTAASFGCIRGDKSPLWQFNVGKTDWHTDAAFGSPDAHQSAIVNAWIPLTDARLDNSCLLVAPGSHVLIPSRIVSRGAAKNAIPLYTKPGDVVFLHNNILHAASENISQRDYRWAVNFRYLPTGQPTGRPFLPAFIARSRSAPETELRDAVLWQEMWRGALKHVAQCGVSDSFRTYQGLPKVVAEWRAATRSHRDWLSLDEKLSHC